MFAKMKDAIKRGELEEVRDMLQTGFSLSDQPDGGYGLLQSTIINDQPQISKLLLKHKCRVNAYMGKQSDTPLHLAVMCNNFDLTDILIRQGANICCINETGKTPYEIAIENQNMKIAEVLQTMRSEIEQCGPELCSASNVGDYSKTKKLLEVRISPNVIFANRYTPLHFAAKNGYKDIVELFLTQNDDHNARTLRNKTPLHLAIEYKHHEVALLLLEYCENLDLQDSKGKTALHYAVEKGMTSLVNSLLLKGASTDLACSYKKHNNFTALHIAVEKGFIRIMKLILRYKNGIEKQDISPLLLLAVKKNQFNAFKILLDCKLNINWIDESGNTSLTYAVMSRHRKIVKLLLDYGADVNSICTSSRNYGCTPLHFATREGNFDVVKLLLDHGANANQQDGHGNTALTYSVKASHKKIVKLLLENGANVNVCSSSSHPYAFSPLHFADNVNITKLLLKSNADVNSGADCIGTPICFVAKRKQEEIVKILLKTGANLDSVDEEGKSVLHYAIENGWGNVVDFLIANSPSIISKTNPLIICLAAKRGYEEVVHKFILENNVDCDVQDNDGMTTLNYAVIKKWDDIVKLLINKGASVNLRSSLESKEGFAALHFAIEDRNEYALKLLLHANADLNAITKGNLNPLLLAARKKNKSMVELLIHWPNSALTNLDQQDENGRTLLHFAVDYAWADIFQTLISRGASVNVSCSSYRRTPLHLASRKGNKYIIKLILDSCAEYGTYLDAVDTYGKTALCYAVECRQEDIVRMLINKGASVNVARLNEGRMEGFTTLHLAIMGDNMPIIKLIIDAEADLNVRNDEGLTPLLYALHWNFTGNVKEIVNLILEKKTNLDAQDNDGKTLLHFASCHSWIDIVQTVLDSGASVNLPCNKGYTALHFAVQSTSVYLSSYKIHLDTVNLILSAQADVNAVADGCITPVLIAAKKGVQELVKLLLEKGANFHIQDDAGNTVLHYAIERGWRNVIELLLNKCTSPQLVCSLKNKEGYTPLHNAVNGSKSDEFIVKMILDAKADINETNKRSETPVLLAAKKINISVVELLIQRGANISCQCDDGMTLLHYAAGFGWAKIVRALLIRGCQINIACTENDSRGYTPLHFAAERGHIGVIKSLLNFNAFINATAEGNITPILLAAASKRRAAVELFLKEGSSFNSQDTEGRTVLHFATMHGWRNVVEILLKAGASVDIACQINGYTPLHYAVTLGDATLTKLFLDGNSNPNILGKNSIPPILMAAQLGFKEVVEVLIEYGANVNVEGKLGITPLLCATMLGWQITTETLLKAGACVNIAYHGNEEFTPLHYAAKRGDVGIVKAILDKNGDINALTKCRSTPLLLAAHLNHKAVVELLLEHGARLDLEDGSRMSALHYGAKNGCSDVVEMLINKGACVNVPHYPDSIHGTYYSWTPLHFAVDRGDLSCVVSLVSAKADVNAKSRYGLTPFLMARKVPIIELFAKNGADVNGQDSEGNTLLHKVVESWSRYDDVVRYLLVHLRHEININSQNKKGNTPLHIASSTHGFYITSREVGILLDHGADVNILNNDNQTPLDVIKRFTKDHSVLTNHISKLRAADFSVTVSVCSSRGNYLYYEQCLTEIKAMKDTKILPNNQSFFDLLTMFGKPVQISSLPSKAVLDELKRNAYKETFPIYSDILNNIIEKCLDGKEIVESSIEKFPTLLRHLPHLPFLCIQMIFNYLTVKDLINFNRCDMYCQIT